MINEKVIINKTNLPELVIECIKKLEYYNELNDEEMYYSTLEL